MHTEGEEDDFIKERPCRTSASQVWRIWALFQLFGVILALVWLFFGDFQSSLEIFSHFLWRFSVIVLVYGDFQSFFLEIFGHFMKIFVAD